MHPAERYLSDINAIRATRAGTGETSYYPALAGLLNEIGKTLQPKVLCVLQLQNRGAGMPDGGLFTAEQFRGKGGGKYSEGALTTISPTRGVIEVKSPAEELQAVLESEQIFRYWEHYGSVLVTNCRAFALIGRTSSGQPSALEIFSLAESEEAFWHLAAHPRSGPDSLRERFVEYLLRAMLHTAPLVSPPEVAALLASYARDARARIEAAQLPSLAGLQQALENTLGLCFQGRKGEHFFRSTLIQTLFYGIFSAWVLWARKARSLAAAKTQEKTLKYSLRSSTAAYGAEGVDFDWHTAVWEYTIGGYQVIKKWLSYRERPLLGRGLTVAEVRHVTETARRLASLVALQPILDTNYRAVAANVYRIKKTDP